MQTPSEFTDEILSAYTAAGPTVPLSEFPDAGDYLRERTRRSKQAVADLIRTRDAEVAEAARAETRYVVFSADWCEPPGDVIAVFATKAEAWAHIRGPGDGYGWSIVEVPAPAVEP